MNRRVAVIDVGSNSIKVLVAEAQGDRGMKTLSSRAIDARISRGISRPRPELGVPGMEAGIDAIRLLWREASDLGAERIQIVATSAVRDAANGDEFRRRVQAATGCDLRVLDGGEEARLIGRGLGADPSLCGLADFYVFDLGGGSLECLCFRDRSPRQSLSLQLGCVRLTELFVKNPGVPLPDPERRAIATHVRDGLAASDFRFDLPSPEAVFCGGSMTTARAVLAAAAGGSLATSPAVVSLRQLEALADRICSLTLDERRSAVPGLPAERADIFATALVTILAVADAAQVPALRHSFRNLRYGLAAELLGAPGPGADQ